MILALDLPAQLWPLLELILAIFQPVIVLLLCGGVVVASMHLFAMLGTQWGNRRVTGKALIFSLGIHASLIFAVIAMIPEYQPQWIRSAFDENLSVDVTIDSSMFSETLGSAETTDPLNPSASMAVRQPWDRISTSVASIPERAALEVPHAIPPEMTSVQARPVPESVHVPDPVFVPLPPGATESSELARAEIPRDYNPAVYQPVMDVVARPEPSQTPSRAAPAIPRAAPGLSSLPERAPLTRLPRPASSPLDQPLTTDFNPGAETLLPSALPNSDADVLPEMKPEQLPRRVGAAPFQITDSTGRASTPTESLPAQSGAPSVMPQRSAPRPIAGSSGGLAKLERTKPRSVQGHLQSGARTPPSRPSHSTSEWRPSRIWFDHRN